MKTKEEVKAHIADILKIIQAPWASAVSVALSPMQRDSLTHWLAALTWVVEDNKKLNEMRELLSRVAKEA